MPDKILLKRSLTSGSIPTTSSLDVGELAINVPDGKVFVKQSGSIGHAVRSLLTLDTPNSGNIQLTGSITASNVLATNFIGSASYAITASYAMNGGGGGGVSSSYATTSSFAITASYLLTYPAFTFDGGTPSSVFTAGPIFDLGGVT